MRVGIVSDTHSKLPARLAEVFAGVDHIIHAGDIERFDDLIELRAIAPVTAVAGNCDSGELGMVLRPVEQVTLGGVKVAVVHDLADLSSPWLDATLVVHGHTHEPEILTDGGVMWLDPGSATLPRGGGVPTVAIAVISDGHVEASILAL